VGGQAGWRAGTTAPKVAATVGTVAAWAAVTALGTWGTFPGSSLAAAGSPGQVSLEVDGPAGVPLEFSGLLPGGAVTQAVTLVNDGGALSAVVLSTVVVETSLLDSDPTDGLQLRVESCSVAWTPEWTCAGERALSAASGPVVRQAELREPASRTGGGTDHLAVTVTLPATAGSQFQGLRSELVLTFTGVQWAGNR
jgi:hypothetical protein